jgi:hypothetical protein
MPEAWGIKDLGTGEINPRTVGDRPEAAVINHVWLKGWHTLGPTDEPYLLVFEEHRAEWNVDVVEIVLVEKDRHDG